MAKTVVPVSYTRAIAAEVVAPKPAEKKSRKPRREKPPVDLQAALRRLGPFPKIEGPYDPRIEDPETLAKQQLDWAAQKARIVSTWRKRAMVSDAEAVQARNNPTEDIAVDLTDEQKKVRKNSTRVRQSEAWRYKQLTPMQRQAESEMQFAWTVRTAGLGAAVSGYGRPRGGGGGLDTHAEVEGYWRDWNREALSRKIHVGAVIDCIAEPRTLKDIEKAHKLDVGEALANYQRALDVWCVLRRWVRETPPPALDTESTVAA